MDADDEPLGVARIDFNEGEEGSLKRLAGVLQLVGSLQIMLAGITVVLALWLAALGLRVMSPVLLLVTLLGVVYAALPVWQGMLLREAGEQFGRVAGSDEDDQEYLASAFRRLRVVFLVEFLLGLYVTYRSWG